MMPHRWVRVVRRVAACRQKCRASNADVVPTSPFVNVLTAAEVVVLTASSQLRPQRAGWWCGRGSCWPPPMAMANTAIAASRVCMTDTVRKWRHRFVQHRLEGWRTVPLGPPTGSPRSRSPQVKALACALPADRGVPLSRWSAAELADEAVARGHCTGHLRVHGRAAGWPRTRSSPGGTGPGSSPATRTSPPRPAGCSTCSQPLARRTARRRRVRDQRRREDPIQALRRRHPALPTGPGRPARRVRVPARRRPGLLGRIRRPPRQRDRPLRAQDRHRPLRRPRRAGHDQRALRLGPTRVLDRRQRLLPPRPGLRSTACRRPGPPPRWSTCPSTPPG